MYSQQKAELEKELADRAGLSVSIESAVTFINLFSAISGNVLVCWTITKYPRPQTYSLHVCRSPIFS